MTILNEETFNKGEVFRTLKKIPKVHTHPIIGVSYIRDSISQQVYLVTCAHDSLKVWEVDEVDPVSLKMRQEIKGWRSGAQDFDITFDGKMAAVVGVDSLIHAINISLSDRTHSTDVFSMGFMEQWYVRISPCRSRYLTVSFSGFLSQLSLKGIIEDKFSFPGARQVSSLSYSPDGKMVAVANNEGIVTILNAPKLETRFLFEAHAVKVRATCFSPSSNNLLTGSDDKIVKLYMISADKAQLVRSFCGHRSCVTAVRFHPRKPQFIASSSNDGTVILWNTAQDGPVHIFQRAHEGVVKSLSFSLDGFYIASVGEDCAICIHQLSNQEAAVNLDWEVANQEAESLDSVQNSANDFTQPTTTKRKDDVEEEDELLERAKRDLEGISDDERFPL